MENINLENLSLKELIRLERNISTAIDKRAGKIFKERVDKYDNYFGPNLNQTDYEIACFLEENNLKMNSESWNKIATDFANKRGWIDQNILMEFMYLGGLA